MHYLEKYLSISYKDMNCSKFVEHILNDHFKKNISFPQSEGFIFRQSEQIKENLPSFCIETEDPRDGDLVLMRGIRRMSHVGLYVQIKKEHYVIHTEARLRTAALHKIKDLYLYGYGLEGFYTWLK